MISVALCCMAKMENRYLREWVEYHLDLGFDHIFVYDNNDVNSERCETPIKEYIEKSCVSVVDYRGKVQTACQIQVQAYENCYKTYGKDYDWIMFLDVDEFLVLQKHKAIKEYLSDKAFEKAKCIRINWKCHTDNGDDKYVDKPVRERFKEFSKNEEVNKHYKYLIRTGIPNLRIPNVHYSSKVPNTFLNNGIETQFTCGTKLTSVNHDWAYIAHYATKSMEEFVEIKRRRRGNGSSKNRLNVSYYWQYNNFNSERDKVLKRLLS